jgi:hypothetical protein
MGKRQPLGPGQGRYRGASPAVPRVTELAGVRKGIRRALTEGKLPERKAVMQTMLAEIRSGIAAASDRSFAYRSLDHRID